MINLGHKQLRCAKTPALHWSLHHAASECRRLLRTVDFRLRRL
jgi:hypothetical protein